MGGSLAWRADRNSTRYPELEALEQTTGQIVSRALNRAVTGRNETLAFTIATSAKPLGRALRRAWPSHFNDSLEIHMKRKIGPMQVSKRGLVEIASHEGIVPMPYFDSVGVATIGIGHAEVSGRPPNPRHMERGVEISMDEVFEMFKDDISSFARGVDRAVKVPVSQSEFDALVSFHYNTGGIARATITKRLNNGDRKGAADAFMMWRRPPEIIGRRRKEQTLFRTGSYSSGGWASVFKATNSGRVIWSSGKRVNVAALLGEDQAPHKITAVLRAGSMGEDVVRMQKVLKVHADGDFGPVTLAALKDYQSQNGLTVDGIAGPQTLGHMGLA